VDESGTNHATAEKAVYTYILTNYATLSEPHWQTNADVVLSGNAFVFGSRGTYRSDPITWDRINDVISTPNVLEMRIKASQSNAPGMFDTKMPNDKPAPAKPATK
jgi:hypothetical protein